VTDDWRPATDDCVCYQLIRVTNSINRLVFVPARLVSSKLLTTFVPPIPAAVQLQPVGWVIGTKFGSLNTFRMLKPNWKFARPARRQHGSARK